MSARPLNNQDKKAGENGGNLSVTASEINGLDQLNFLSNGGNGSVGTNGEDGTYLIRSREFLSNEETAVYREDIEMELYKIDLLIDRAKQREIENPAKKAAENVQFQHVDISGENNIQRPSGYDGGSSSGASFTNSIQNYGNSHPSQGYSSIITYEFEDERGPERPPRSICKRQGCSCPCVHRPDSNMVCDCVCCVNGAFGTNVPFVLSQFDPTENRDISSFLSPEHNHEGLEDYEVFDRRESPPNSSPEVQYQSINASLPQNVPRILTDNASNITQNEVQNPLGFPAFPQPPRGRGRPLSSTEPAAIRMRVYNAERSKYVKFGKGIIQRFNEFPPEARQIIEEQMSAAGIGNPTSSQRGF